MILYDLGTYHIGFIFRFKGATFLKALVYAVPAAAFSGLIRYLYEKDETTFDFLGIEEYLGKTQAWNALNITIGLLLATRSGQSLKRFWEGLTLVQKMSAEWYSATSSLIAFSRNGRDAMRIKDFQHTLVRLISLLHGSGLHQIDFLDNENFEVIGIDDLDAPTMSFLAHCRAFDVNRVEVILHWVQELVVESIKPEVVMIPTPILSRVFQELSRGLVNLNDARKITEIPFPFPFAQIIVILLLAETVIIPFMVAMFVESVGWAVLITFVCTLSMWSVNMIAGELEQPFGCDANDLPLGTLQEKFNKSLLVLLDPRAQRTPGLKSPECLDHLTVSMLKQTTLSFNEKKKKNVSELAQDVQSRFNVIGKSLSGGGGSITTRAKRLTQAIFGATLSGRPSKSQPQLQKSLSRLGSQRVSVSEKDAANGGEKYNTGDGEYVSETSEESALVCLDAFVRPRMSFDSLPDEPRRRSQYDASSLEEEEYIVRAARRRSEWDKYKWEEDAHFMARTRTEYDRSLRQQDDAILQEAADLTRDASSFAIEASPNIEDRHVASDVASGRRSRQASEAPESLNEWLAEVSNTRPLEVEKTKKGKKTSALTPPSTPTLDAS